jgi:S-adenosylmethionine:tRNA ribosyltransferase-isomerase
MRTADLELERPARLPATRPPEARGLARDEVRLLVSTEGGHEHARFHELPAFLPAGSLLVVNQSATLPASLPARGSVGPFRLNLSTRYGEGTWLAEPRPDAVTPGPIRLSPGERFLAAGLRAYALTPFPGLQRLWFVRVEGDVDRAMAYRGEPIRYGYLEPPHPALADYQTVFATVPGGAEMPSAARPFTRRLIGALRGRGVQFAFITLHAGVSSLEIGQDGIEDHAVAPEPFEVGRDAAELVTLAKAQGRPVIAVGTTVVRALESAWSAGRIRAATGFTRRFLRPGHGAHIVDGLITGFHDPRASHLALLTAIAGRDLVMDAYDQAVREGYLWHEFGDSHLILPPGRRERELADPVP